MTARAGFRAQKTWLAVSCIKIGLLSLRVLARSGNDFGGLDQFCFLVCDCILMTKKTLAQKMEPVLRRPGMYVGLSPVKLLWYLNGMFDLEGVLSGDPNWPGESLFISLAERFELAELENGGDYYSAVEDKLLQGKPDDSMKLVCDVAREMLARIESPI
jgi:hypothetical protein